MANFMVAIPPEELGEYPEGHPKHDPDYDCMKLRVITVEMQKAEEIAEKRLYNEFVDEPVQEPQKRVWATIPKNNLCIPFKWFDYESDAAVFAIAVARVNNVAVDCFGKPSMCRSLCSFLDSVLQHRHLRMKKEDDPLNMTLQDRRIRHWKAVIAESCVARDFTLRLVRHVTLMLVGASFDFARQNGQRSQSSNLSGKIEKLREWFEENDREDLEAFECLQPKRMELKGFKANGPQSNGNEKRKGHHNSRKRKADTLHAHESVRPKRQYQMRQPPPPPPKRLDEGIKHPRRIAQGKGGQRRWAKRG